MRTNSEPSAIPVSPAAGRSKPETRFPRTPSTKAAPSDNDHGKKETLSEVINRMQAWDNSFLFKVLRESRSHTWKTAAQVVLEQRMEDSPKSNPDKN